MSNARLIEEVQVKIDACDLMDAWNLIERLADALEVADAEVARLRAWIAKDDE
jgi:hypothetical protein